VAASRQGAAERWPRPGLTVDVVLLAGEPVASILLIERAHEPFTGAWALPGGFVEEGERICDAAVRELAEETAIATGPLALLGVYDTPGRDPRGWTVSVTYLRPLAEEVVARGGDDASQARWFALDALPALAFDHAAIIADAIASVRGSR
jgi:8-oxo-dGTP diphosphatase